ncbi:MAG: carboxypeptidase-like regulatory domain-containing protein [Patescibacteria group bacterium]
MSTLLRHRRSSHLKTLLLGVLVLVFFPLFTFASTTNGTIDSTYKYAKGLDSNVGKINFGLSLGNVLVTDSAITGYAWGENIGWINLAPTNGGVTNNGEGVLSGYAWGDHTGWVNFAPTNGGVTINTSGDFLGYAWSQNYGWLIFNCVTNSSCGTDNFKVSTDWRPISTRPVIINTVTLSTAGGGTILPPTPPTPPTLPTPPPVEPTPAPVLPRTTTPTLDPAPTPALPQTENTGVGVPASDDAGFESSGGMSSSNGNLGAPSSVSPTVPKTTETLWSVTEDTKHVLAYAEGALQKTKISIVEFTETPVGYITTNTLTALGVVGGGTVVVTSIAGGGATLSVPAIILYISRFWGFLLVLLGLRRRTLPWGTVYDSVTKQPLDPAYVVLKDMNGKEVATSITDLDGRFGFFVAPGVYRMEANKTNYKAPSQKLAGKSNDVLYDGLYFGEEITIGLNGTITRNIPMDAEAFDWNEFAKRDKKLMKFYSRRSLLVAKISDALFTLGGIVALALYFVHPDKYNTILLVLYLLIFVLHRFGLRTKSYGTIIDAGTGAPLSFAIVRVFFKDQEKELFHRVADEYGRYYCLLPKGEYYVTIEKKNDDESYTHVFTSDVINAKKGIINTGFVV